MANVGEPTYASDVNNLVLTTRKPSDLGRASTTSVSMDNELFTTVDAGKYFVMQALLVYNGLAAGDFKGGFAPPSGGTFTSTTRAQDGTATTSAGSIVTDLQSGSTGFGFGCIGTGTNLTALIYGLLYTGSGGTFGFSWAQVTSNVTASTLKAGSFFTLFATS